PGRRFSYGRCRHALAAAPPPLGGTLSACGSPLALVVKATDVRPRPVEWLWPKRVPLGGITVLAGNPGLGKALLTLDLVARESRGEFGTPRGSVLLTAEDSLEHTVRPRLDAAGADVSLVHLVRDPASISLPARAE